MNTLIFFYLFLLAPFAQSQISPNGYADTNAFILEGTNVGNGGNTVVCTLPDESERVIFYDYYESLAIGDPIELNYTHLLSENFKKIVGAYIESFKLIDPYIGAYLDLELKFFDRNAVFFQDEHALPISFIKTQDLHEEVFLLPNCKIKQTIVQYNDKLSTRSKYYIDIVTFNKMDEFNKSVAILHELIYSYFISIGMYGDSRPTRQMTRFIFSLPPHLDLSSYKILQKHSRHYAEVSKAIGLDSISLYNLGLGYLPVSLEKTELRYCPMSNVIQSAFIKNYNISKLIGISNFHFTGTASFYCSGDIKRLSLTELKTPIKVRIKGKEQNCYTQLEFKNNKIETCL